MRTSKQYRSSPLAGAIDDATADGGINVADRYVDDDPAMNTGDPEKAAASQAVLTAVVLTALYSSTGSKVPDDVELARAIVPPTVEAAVVRILTHAYCEAPGDMDVALIISDASVGDVLSFHAEVAVLDSRRNVLAVNVPAAYSESVQDASVTLAPTPRTRAPASTARTRVKLRRRDGATCLLTCYGAGVAEVATNSQVAVADSSWSRSESAVTWMHR